MSPLLNNARPLIARFHTEESEQVLGTLKGIHVTRRYHRLPQVLALSVQPESLESLLAITGCTFYPDPVLDPALAVEDFEKFKHRAGFPTPSLNEVLELIGAPEAWAESTGKQVRIAVIDSGINGDAPEFPGWKKLRGWDANGGNPWADPLGHGTMVAAIAAASSVDTKVRAVGVAPDALLYPCKTGFQVSEIMGAYEHLLDWLEEEPGPLIVNNSFGFNTMSPPIIDGLAITEDFPLTGLIQDIVNQGACVVFAAGNYNIPEDANHAVHCSGQCTPDTIWAWNSLSQVLTVGDADHHNRVRNYSSRGPGQWSKQGGTKPDCVAPTGGYVLFGNSYRDAAEGWGSSGAAGLVSGALALSQEKKPNDTPAQHYNRIISACRSIPFCTHCAGAGILDCRSI